MMVRDIMSRDVVTVSADATLSELARLLTLRMITGAPVVDKEGKLVGVVSNIDLVARAAASAEGADEVPGYYRQGPPEGKTAGGFPEELRVRDIMRTTLITLAEHGDVRDAAELMLRYHVHRIIVVREGKPVGVVTTTDLVRLLLDLLPAPEPVPALALPPEERFPPRPGPRKRKPGGTARIKGG
jgi:CBS domain-containing protein